MNNWAGPDVHFWPSQKLGLTKPSQSGTTMSPSLLHYITVQTVKASHQGQYSCTDMQEKDHSYGAVAALMASLQSC